VEFFPTVGKNNTTGFAVFKPAKNWTAFSDTNQPTPNNVIHKCASVSTIMPSAKLLDDFE
jgi:hypothetical protein